MSFRIFKEFYMSVVLICKNLSYHSSEKVKKKKGETAPLWDLKLILKLD